MLQSYDVQPAPRTRDQMLEGMHLMTTFFKPKEAGSASSQMKTVDSVNDVTKTESRNVT